MNMHMIIAKWIVAVVAVYAYGGFIADAVVPGTSAPHPWNPKWPQHAKFHNAQTMLLGIFMGTLSVYMLFGTGWLTHQMFYLATVTASLYWLSMVFAQAFPLTAWYDPEFKDTYKRPLGFSPQQLLSLYAVPVADRCRRPVQPLRPPATRHFLARAQTPDDAFDHLGDQPVQGNSFELAVGGNAQQALHGRHRSQRETRRVTRHYLPRRLPLREEG